MSSSYNLFQTSIHAYIHSPIWVVSPVWEILDPPLHTNIDIFISASGSTENLVENGGLSGRAVPVS